MRTEERLEAPGPILIPLDGSDEALHAVPVALEFARLENRPPLVFHANAAAGDPRRALSEVGVAPEKLRGAAFETARGDPAEAILRVAAERGAELIVLATRTGAKEAHGGLGPVAEAVVRAATCPVVLVRPEAVPLDEPWAIRVVLLPHDGTPTSAAAIVPAVDLVRKAHARLEVVHVAVPGAPEPTESGAIRAPQYVDQPQHEWPQWAGEFLERLHGTSEFNEPLHLEVARGQPGPAIVQCAQKCGANLIVTAWRGSLDAAHALAIRRILRAAPCPIYVVRVPRGEGEDSGK